MKFTLYDTVIRLYIEKIVQKWRESIGGCEGNSQTSGQLFLLPPVFPLGETCPGHCSFIPLIFYHVFCFLSIRLRVKFLSLLWTLFISYLPLLYEATVHPFNSLLYPKVLENYITQSKRPPACSSALSLCRQNQWKVQSGTASLES